MIRIVRSPSCTFAGPQKKTSPGFWSGCSMPAALIIIVTDSSAVAVAKPSIDLCAVSIAGASSADSHKQSNEPYNVTLGVLSQRGTQANGKQTVHCINHMDYWKVKIYFNMIDHHVNSRRPCYSQVYVQPQLLIESHIRCEFTANHHLAPDQVES